MVKQRQHYKVQRLHHKFSMKILYIKIPELFSVATSHSEEKSLLALGTLTDVRKIFQSPAIQHFHGAFLL